MMLPIEGQPILTVAQMRAAEQRAAPTPDAMYALMERAGAGVAEAVRRLAAGAEVLILCGPGNNGGDGYVAARMLREWGHPVRVAALGEPATELARRARAGWAGPSEPLSSSLIDWDRPGPVLLDAIFGTGLSRPIDEGLADALESLIAWARMTIAVDLPTGVASDTGQHLSSSLGICSVTLALGALKPAHVLMPAAEHCGNVRLLDLGLDLGDLHALSGSVSPDATVGPPLLAAPSRSMHKYSRGMVVLIGGAMPGAAALAITAAMRAGAGYGLLFSDEPGAGLPHAIVQRRWSADALARSVAGKNAIVVIGPGLGRDGDARAKLDTAIAHEGPLVIDGDALHLLTDADFAGFRQRHDGHDVVLTPHAGEFAAMFGTPDGSKIEAARAAARGSGAIVVFKGPDTVVAHPSGQTKTLTGACSWLSTAGTGDVLAGTITGLWHATIDGAEAAVWLHAEAARRCGPSFIADDLAHALTAARASL